MTVDEVYKIVLYAAAKNLQTGYVSPEDFNTTINNAQRAYVTYLLGSFQQYTPGRPVARVELGQNSVVRQRLAPIIYGYNLNLDVSGFTPYPGDYLQTDSIWSIYGYRRVRFADQHKLASIYNSVIDPIANSPIYTLEDTGFLFYPTRPYLLSQTRLHYVRDAPRMVWGYTEDANGIPVYSEARSTQPVFDDASILEIISRALQLIGINLQSGVLAQYAQQIKVEGT